MKSAFLWAGLMASLEVQILMRLSILILWPKRCEADSFEVWFSMQSRDLLKLESEVDDDSLL